MKIDLRGVSETLLVTLYMRAKDAKSNHPFLNDQKPGMDVILWSISTGKADGP